MTKIKSSVSDPQPDPDSGVFWYRIQGLKQRSKMLNHHKKLFYFFHHDLFQWTSFDEKNLYPYITILTLERRLMCGNSIWSIVVRDVKQTEIGQINNALADK